MNTTTTTTAPAVVLTLANVETIGRGETKKQNTAANIVAATPADYDWSARGAVPAAILAAMGLTEHPAPQKKGAKGAQKETAYGVGFRVLADAVRAIVKETKETPIAMRVSLTGTGSAVVPADHPAYALLLALLGAEAGDESGE